jgi:THO complex subunit 2
MEVDSSTEANPAPESPWIPELEELFDAIRKVAPGNAADVVG